MTWVESYSSVSWTCVAAGCGNTPSDWTVYNRKTKRRERYCQEHVPPLGTSRITKYKYFGSIRCGQEEDFEPGERVTTGIGGKTARGTILRYDDGYGGWEIDWDGWMVDTGFPSHWLRKLTPIQQLAECAPEEPEWKRTSS